MAFAQCVKGNPHRTRTEFGTPGNLVELRLPVQPFQFDIAIPRAKEIIDLGGDDLGGRPFKLRTTTMIVKPYSALKVTGGHK